MKKNKLLIYGIFALALSFLLLIPMQGNIFSVAAEEEPIIYIGEITGNDQSGNMWNHGGTSSKKIRGTIVYDGIAENIDVDIPWLGYKTSESVTIKGVTFTLRCGPNKVSIKASSSVLCNGNTTFFAFGVA